MHIYKNKNNSIHNKTKELTQGKTEFAQKFLPAKYNTPHRDQGTVVNQLTGFTRLLKNPIRKARW